MRKIIIISVACVFALNCAFAQEEGTEKKVKQEVLPQKGDFAIGLDMANFVKGVLNNIAVGANDDMVKGFTSDFFGKYFISDKGAIRARLGIKISQITDRQFVSDDAANRLNPLTQISPLLEVKTVDVYKYGETGFELGVGYECRRSLWRVQGYVGGEIFGGMFSDKRRFEYGNPMTRENQTPTIGYPSIISMEDPIDGNIYNVGNNSTRVLETKAIGMTLGAAVYIGADLFICRNLSIGAEFNLDGRYTRIGEMTGKTETWLLEQAYVAVEPIKPVRSFWGFNPGGRLNLMIYF